MEAKLKKLLMERKYEKCIPILEKFIDEKFTQIIQVKYPAYKYTTILNMADIADKVFDKQTKEIFKKYFNLIHEDFDDDFYLDCLFEIYRDISEK